MPWSRSLLNSTCGFVIVCTMILGWSSAHVVAELLPTLDGALDGSIQLTAVHAPATKPVGRSSLIDSNSRHMGADHQRPLIHVYGDTARSAFTLDSRGRAAVVVSNLGDNRFPGFDRHLGSELGFNDLGTPALTIHHDAEARILVGTPSTSTATMSAAIAVLGAVSMPVIVARRRRKKGRRTRRAA